MDRKGKHLIRCLLALWPGDGGADAAFFSLQFPRQAGIWEPILRGHLETTQVGAVSTVPPTGMEVHRPL